jgi:hypothetical protein
MFLRVEMRFEVFVAKDAAEAAAHSLALQRALAKVYS